MYSSTSRSPKRSKMYCSERNDGLVVVDEMKWYGEIECVAICEWMLDHYNFWFEGEFSVDVAAAAPNKWRFFRLHCISINVCIMRIMWIPFRHLLEFSMYKNWIRWIRSEQKNPIFSSHTQWERLSFTFKLFFDIFVCIFSEANWKFNRSKFSDYPYTCYINIFIY